MNATKGVLGSIHKAKSSLKSKIKVVGQYSETTV